VQPVIYLPVSTWGNHNKIFPLGGVPAKPYHYYDPTTRGLDYQGAHRRTCNTIVLASILTMGQMYGEREEYCCLKEIQAALINIRIDQLY